MLRRTRVAEDCASFSWIDVSAAAQLAEDKLNASASSLDKRASRAVWAEKCCFLAASVSRRCASCESAARLNRSSLARAAQARSLLASCESTLFRAACDMGGEEEGVSESDRERGDELRHFNLNLGLIVLLLHVDGVRVPVALLYGYVAGTGYYRRVLVKKIRLKRRTKFLSKLDHKL